MAGTLTTLIPAARDTSPSSNSISMGSATYTAGRIYLIAVRNRHASDPAESPSISGGSITWSKANINFNLSTAEHLAVFVGICTLTETATLSITFLSTQTNCSWHVAEGTDLSVVSIADLVVQGRTLSDSTATPSLAFTSGFAAADNLTYAVASYAAVGTGQNIDAEANMTELDYIESSGLNVGYLHISWKASEEATVSWTKSNGSDSGHGILELRLGSATVSVTGEVATATAAAIEADISAGDVNIAGAVAAATSEALAGSLDTPTVTILGEVAAATASAEAALIDSGTVLGPSRIGGRPARF